MKRKYTSSFIVFFLVSLFGLPQKTPAQPDTRGTDFWVCFPQNAKNEFNAGLNFKLYITGDVAAKGIVLIPGNKSIPFSIAAGEVTSINIDTNVQVMSSDRVEALGIHVHSDQPVAIYGLSNRKASTDTYVAFPTNVLGTTYRALCYNPLAGTEDAFTSQATVVGTEDNTILTVTLSCNIKGGRRSGETYNVTLQRGEVYQMQGTTRGDLINSDLTGTLVTSTKPVAFFTGHICAQVPQNVNFCDQLLEEEAPANTWGRQFLVGKLQGKDSYIVRVVANEDDTKIFIDRKFVTTLAAGAFYEARNLTGNVLIKSDRPVLVGQFATSAEADSVKVGDPFLMLITPTEQFLSSYRFVTPVGEGPIRYHTGAERQRNFDSIFSANSKSVAVSPKSKINGTQAEAMTPAFKYSQEYLDNAKKEDAAGSGWHHYINVIAPSRDLNSLRLDGNTLATSQFVPVGITHFAVAQIEIPFGSHVITCDRPFGLYSYGFGVGGDNYDSYGNSAGQRVSAIERAPDTSKPTLEIEQSDTSSDLVLIARDDRINDLGLATIMITDSANTTNPIAYPVFDIGAPEFRFTVKRTSLTSCFYVKLQDFAKNQSNYALCPASPNSGGASNEVLTYNITPLLIQEQAAHEVYPVELYPSPAKYGQPVNINFTNSIPEIIGVQVLDEGGNIVTEIQKKQLTGSGKHSLIYNSDRYVSGSFFFRFSAYSQDDQVLYRQDEHFVVAH
jgi:hypothetical protein